MSARRRFIVLIVIMTVVALGSVGGVLSVLYQSHIEQHRQNLVELAISQARLIEAVAKFDSVNTPLTQKGGWKPSTLSQIRDSHASYKGFGKTGEIVMAQHRNRVIEFVLPQRHSNTHEPQPVPWDSPYAEPMRKALSGLSGSMIGLDYRGETVLAAYEPAAYLDMGIVTKIDMWEIRIPFIEAGAIAVILSAFLIAIGGLIFRHVSNPILQHLEDRIENQKKLIKRQSILQNLQHRVVFSAGEAASFNEAIRFAINTVCKNLNFQIGHACEPDSNQSDQFISTDIWYLSDPEKFSEFKQATEQTIFSLGVGLPGHVLEKREPTYVKDLGSDPNSPRAKLVNHLNVASAFAFPVMVDDQIHAILEFFSEDIIEFDELLINSITQVGLALGRVAERKLSHSELEDRMNELSDARKAALNMMQDIEESRQRSNDLHQQAENELKERKKAQEKLRVQIDELSDARKAALNMMQDIEESRVRAEELRDEAEAATKAKAAFLATVSHEIRTPMNGVMGMLELMKSTPLNMDQKDMVRVMGESAETLLTVINDILDFFKIEAGKLELENIEMSLREVMEGVSSLFASNIHSKELDLLVHVDPSIPDRVKGDSVRIRQIVSNLLSNAIKFTEKGFVTIELSIEGANDGQAMYRFNICDTGIGMTEEQMSKLFQAFSQADTSTTRKFGGSGLGLTICQRLVELMGGEIGVDSEKGKGSCFWFTLPFEQTNLELAIDNAALSDVSVLVCDQLSESQKVFDEYLRAGGSDVFVVTTTDEALSALKQKSLSKHNVAIVDIEFYDEDIEKFIGQLREAGKNNNTKILLVAPPNNALARSLVNKELLDGFLTKPVFLNSLFRSVRESVGLDISEYMTHGDAFTQVTNFTAPAADEAAKHGAMLLVAEDNKTNQLVIGQQLDNLGYVSEFANDGAEALKMLRENTHKYGLLLSDCHMPIMDGYELSQSIRAEEPIPDIRFPIVALTADALQDAREKCLEAGMDDYLSKPTKMPLLDAMIIKWFPKAAQLRTEQTGHSGEDDKSEIAKPDNPLNETESSVGEDQPLIDLSALKEIFGDDMDTLKEILNEFVEPSQEIVEDIDKAFLEHSAADLAAAAHKLKSSSRAVGANELADICYTLETAGKSENWDEINEAAPKLPGAMKGVVAYIERL